MMPLTHAVLEGGSTDFGGPVGYVVKRFPRASETFICQELLELERQGVDARVFALRPNDCPVDHAWLADLRAPVTLCDDVLLSVAWKWLHRFAATSPEHAEAAEDVLSWSFRHPDRRGRHRLCEAVAVAEAAGRSGVTHLHAHFANEPAFVALLAARLLGVSFSFTAHAKDIYSAERSPSPETWRLLAERAAFIATVTEDNRRYLHGLLGPRLGPTVLRLYNGVDLESLTPRPETPEATGSVELLTVARLVPKKGLDVLVDAVAALERRRSLGGADLVCRVLGDGPEREALEARAAELGVAHRFRFAGLVPHQEVRAALAKADVFVLPARVTADGDRDALPTVLLEAMACGLPCVATPVGGIPEIIDPRRTGLLVPSDSPLALAEALGELCDPATGAERRRRWGAAGRRRAEELFDRRSNGATLRAWFAGAATEGTERRKAVR